MERTRVGAAGRMPKPLGRNFSITVAATGVAVIALITPFLPLPAWSKWTILGAGVGMVMIGVVELLRRAAYDRRKAMSPPALHETSTGLLSRAGDLARPEPDQALSKALYERRDHGLELLRFPCRDQARRVVVEGAEEKWADSVVQLLREHQCPVHEIETIRELGIVPQSKGIDHLVNNPCEFLHTRLRERLQRIERIAQRYSKSGEGPKRLGPLARESIATPSIRVTLLLEQDATNRYRDWVYLALSNDGPGAAEEVRVRLARIESGPQALALSAEQPIPPGQRLEGREEKLFPLVDMVWSDDKSDDEDDEAEQEVDVGWRVGANIDSNGTALSHVPIAKGERWRLCLTVDSLNAGCRNVPIIVERHALGMLVCLAETEKHSQICEAIRALDFLIDVHEKMGISRISGSPESLGTMLDTWWNDVERYVLSRVSELHRNELIAIYRRFRTAIVRATVYREKPDDGVSILQEMKRYLWGLAEAYPPPIVLLDPPSDLGTAGRSS